MAIRVRRLPAPLRVQLFRSYVLILPPNRLLDTHRLLRDPRPTHRGRRGQAPLRPGLPPRHPRNAPHPRHPVIPPARAFRQLPRIVSSGPHPRDLRPLRQRSRHERRTPLSSIASEPSPTACGSFRARSRRVATSTLPTAFILPPNRRPSRRSRLLRERRVPPVRRSLRPPRLRQRNRNQALPRRICRRRFTGGLNS